MGNGAPSAPGARARARFGAAVGILLAAASAAQAQTREYQLRWRVPPDPDVASYRVFLGQASRAYGAPFSIEAMPPDSGGVASTLLTGLDATRDYYVAMTAVDGAGNESALSNEVRVAAVTCTAADCDDGNSCTVDSCGAVACQNLPVADGTGCDDRDPATFFDRCSAGVCVGQRPQCTSDADCTDSDANVCTGVRRCQDFACVNTAPLVCPASADPCRAASCDPLSGCEFSSAPDGTACSDGDAGTANDACSNGTCAGTPAQCTSDAGCPDTDANACNGKPVCQSLRCVAGPAAPDGTTCDDGDPLTLGDVCSAGACVGRHECESDEDCADPDANVCTGTPVCSGFRCVAGAPPACPEAPVCARAGCDPASGCFVRPDPVGTPCDDGDGATQGDACVADGVCAGELPPPPPPPGDACATAFGPPTAQRLSLTERPDTEMTVVWDAPGNPAGAEVRFRRVGSKGWLSVAGQVIRRDGCRATFAARLERLRPASRYDYAVSGAGEAQPNWSSVRRFRTAPSAGSTSAMRVVFVAGTGSPGAPDAAAAALVRDRIAGHGPHLLLGGGGYAFSNDVIARGLAPDASSAVARWFEQMSPALAAAPFLPVFGDSEQASYWHGEQLAMYADRHPFPDSDDAPQRTYSYDVADAHFLAIDAPSAAALLPETPEGASHLAWIDADLAAARGRGARWLVAYLHIDLWSSEAGAAPVASLRDALGRLFERHRVSLVLSGDGNSAERTRPLLNGSPLRRSRPTSDGVVYLRAGSGGRTAFGTWASPTAPPTTAMRDNVRATHVLLVFEGREELRVRTFGLDVDTGEVHLLDRFTIE